MQLRSRAVEMRLEWEPRDLWIGVYWEYRPHPCTYEVCYNNRMHLWITLLPTLPLHVSWLVRRSALTARPRVAIIKGRDSVR